MDSAMQLTGIHHLTAISARPRDNLAFYTGLLGMRLVKKTVNQDDVSAYHLFYADGKANPGTDLTFFDFPAAPEQRGANSISRTSLRVAGEKSAVPAEHQIRGLGPIVLNVHDLKRTEQVLTGAMNMRRVRDYAAPDAEAQVHVFAMGEGGPAAELHVIEQKDLPMARQGAGGVHHVAFRTPDDEQYHAWTNRLNQLGIRNSAG